jgi:hypothetical protein
LAFNPKQQPEQVVSNRSKREGYEFQERRIGCRMG